MGIPEEKERKEQKKIFKLIMTEDIPPQSDTTLQIQEAQGIPSKTNEKKKNPYIFKLQ